MKLIDVDALEIELLKLLLNGDDKMKSVADVAPLISNAPTVDAVDVETLMHIFGDDEPCNFNGWDDRTDDWCAE